MRQAQIGIDSNWDRQKQRSQNIELGFDLRYLIPLTRFTNKRAPDLFSQVGQADQAGKTFQANNKGRKNDIVLEPYYIFSERFGEFISLLQRHSWLPAISTTLKRSLFFSGRSMVLLRP